MDGQRDAKAWLRLGLRGMAMGAADLVPGSPSKSSYFLNKGANMSESGLEMEYDNSSMLALALPIFENRQLISAAL